MRLNGNVSATQVVRRAEFNLQSSLSADLKGFSLDNDVTVSLGFKSAQSRGVILQDKQLVGTCVCFGMRCLRDGDQHHGLKLALLLCVAG